MASTLELQWPDGSVNVDGEIAVRVLEKVKQAALDALDARIDQIEVGIKICTARGNSDSTFAYSRAGLSR